MNSVPLVINDIITEIISGKENASLYNVITSQTPAHTKQNPPKHFKNLYTPSKYWFFFIILLFADCRQRIIAASFIWKRLSSQQCPVRNSYSVAGSDAAATACPTLLSISSGRMKLIFAASSGNSAASTSFAFSMIRSPPRPEVTLPLIWI